MPDRADQPPSPSRSVAGARSILFVCLGNICRSPLGKAVFVAVARDRGVVDQFHVDSCGTGSWHVGGDADPRTLAVARKYHIPISHRARQLAPLYDFAKFDLILAMDRRNVQDIIRVGGDADAGKVRRLREFDPAFHSAGGHPDDALDVPDPYYGGADGFDRMYHMIRAACDGLLNQLLSTPPR